MSLFKALIVIVFIGLSFPAFASNSPAESYHLTTIDKVFEFEGATLPVITAEKAYSVESEGYRVMSLEGYFQKNNGLQAKTLGSEQLTDSQKLKSELEGHLLPLLQFDAQTTEQQNQLNNRWHKLEASLQKVISKEKEVDELLTYLRSLKRIAESK